MCRLLGLVTTTPRTIEETLGAPDLAQFMAMSRVHRDGWGMAWAPESMGDPFAGVDTAGGVGDVGTGIARWRSTTCAETDPAAAGLTRRARGGAFLVHERWASPGLAVDLSNQHPFATFANGDAAGDEAVFAHNGTIAWTEELADIGRRQWAAAGMAPPRFTGTTDSERYFWLIRAWRAGGASWAAAAAAAVAAIRAVDGRPSLNSVLMTAREFILVAVGASRPPDIARLMREGNLSAPIPPDHDERYFALRWRRTDDSVTFVSSGLTTSGWSDIPDRTITVVDRATLALTTTELAV